MLLRQIISSTESMLSPESVYRDRNEELALLNTVLLCNENDAVEEPVPTDKIEDVDDEEPVFVRNTSTNMKSLSGGDAMAYLEFNRGSTSGLEKRKYTEMMGD
jgi:DNA excision repair protein ERCC-3